MKNFLRGGRGLSYGQPFNISIISLISRCLLHDFRPLRYGRGDATGRLRSLLANSHKLSRYKIGTSSALSIIFCVLFSGLLVSPAWAQEAKGLKKPNALQIGDTIPDEMWNVPLQVVSTPDQINTITLNDYRGKLIILDFWATWCGACIAAFPKMDTLQQQFNNDVEVLSISTESKERVSEFVKARGAQTPNLTFIAEGKEIDNYFKYGTLPHYIWVDAKGVIRSSSESLQVNASNIDEALKGEFNFRTKTDVIVEYDFDRSLLQNVGNDEIGQLYFSSTLIPYHSGYKSMRKISTNRDKGRKITLLNVPLFWLYITAYSTNGQGFWKSNTIVEVKDHEKIVKRGIPGQRYEDWLAAGNGYCYEQIVRYEDRDSSFKYMQADLDRMIPRYKAVVESREIPCYILKISDENKYHKSIANNRTESTSYGSSDTTFNGSNILIDVLVGNIRDSERIDHNIYNETGRNDHITISIPNPRINLFLTNQYLANYGLTISLEKRTKPFLVIKDRPTS